MNGRLDVIRRTWELLRAIFRLSCCLSMVVEGNIALAADDVSSYSTADIRAVLSTAGKWLPIRDVNSAGGPISLSHPNYANIGLPNGKGGLVLNSWAYDVTDTTVPHQTSIVILEQQADGTLAVATSNYVSDPVTNGSNSIVIADLNGDGSQDIFLAAHNETPYVPLPSTAYLSNSNGTFTKVRLNDSSLAHGASISTYNGYPTVFVADIPAPSGKRADMNPYYQYIDNTFSEGQISYPNAQGAWSFSGESVAVADVNGDGQLDMVIGNLIYGPGLSHDPKPPVIGIYKLSDIFNNTGAPTTITPYFNNKPQWATMQSNYGVGVADIPRVWVDDFNHDGKPDIVSIAAFWSPSNYKMLQLSQNTSTNDVVQFVDKTDILNGGYKVDAEWADYDLQMVDIDGSGIKAYFSAGFMWVSDDALQSNYILMNDGTGTLHVYMHDQFQNLGSQVLRYVATQGAPCSPNQPRFIAYLTGAKKINFVTECAGPVVVNGTSTFQHFFTNVPLQLDPAVDFKAPITVGDRNGSMRLRTWAGDDTFYDTNASAAPTTIDGGLGTNTSVYSGKYSEYAISRNSNGTVSVRGRGLADTLKNIQTVKFSDFTVPLSTLQQITNEQAFAYASAILPSMFPGSAVLGAYEQYSYAYFPGSGNYLGLDATGGIWLLGPATNQSLTFVGMLSQFASDISAWLTRAKFP